MCEHEGAAALLHGGNRNFYRSSSTLVNKRRSLADILFPFYHLNAPAGVTPIYRHFSNSAIAFPCL
jgi:hypothetical protein